MKKIRNLKFLVLLITIGVLITTTVLVSYAYMPNNQSFPTTKEGEIGKVYWKFDTDTLYLNNTQVDATYSLIDENDINTNTFMDDKRPWKDVKDTIVNVNIENNIKPTTTYRWFYNFKKLNSIINVNNLDMSNVTNTEDMFYGCTNLKISDVINYGIFNVNNIPISAKGINGETLKGVKLKFTEVQDDFPVYGKVVNGHKVIVEVDEEVNYADLYIGRSYKVEQISSNDDYNLTKDSIILSVQHYRNFALVPRFFSMYFSDNFPSELMKENTKVENSGFKVYNSLEEATKDVDNILEGETLYIKEKVNAESYSYNEYQKHGNNIMDILPKIEKRSLYERLYVFNYKKEIPTSEINIIKKNGLGQILPGAELIITTLDGTQVDKWISDNKAHTLKLEDGDYIIKELKAPDGYILNKEEIKFTIKDQKIIKIDSNRLVSNNENEITIQNEQINEESPETGSFISYNFIILSLIGLLIFGYYLKNKRNIFVK